MGRVFLIGLDAATFELITPWVKDGKLPTFEKLMNDYSYAVLESTMLPITFPAWPCIMTGKNPGKLDVFDFTTRKDYDTSTNMSSNIKGDFIWEILERNGMKSGIINIPGSSPFRSPVSFGEGDFLRKDWVNFDWRTKNTNVGMLPSSPHFENRLAELIDERFDQIEWSMANKDFSYFAINVYAIDQVQHWRWHKPEYMLEMYQKVDARMKSLFEKFEDDDIALIVSDHGQTEIDKFFYINNWLLKEGFIKLKEELKEDNVKDTQKQEKIVNTITNTMIKLKIRKLVPKFVEKMGKKFLSGSAEKGSLPFTVWRENVDWENTKAFSFGTQGPIHINLKGREARGCVEPEDYKKVRDEIKVALKNYLSENGIKADIHLKEDVYSGPYADNGPDMVFMMDGGRIHCKTALRTDDTIFKKPVIGKDPSGEHTQEGVFFAYGKNIKQAKLNVLSVYDMTPTALHYLGIEVPEDMDGRVVSEIFVKNIKPKKSTTKEESLLKEAIGDII